MGKIDISFPPELVIDQIDFVERQTAAGVDGSGAPVEAWAQVYGPATTGGPLPCTVDMEPAGDETVFGQQVMELSATVYFPQLANGLLPDIRIRDRLAYGTWPANGAVRYLAVDEAFDPYRNGTMIVARCHTRAPA